MWCDLRTTYSSQKECCRKPLQVLIKIKKTKKTKTIITNNTNNTNNTITIKEEETKRETD